MGNTKNKNKLSFAMLLVTIGIVYGDIGTSPMYVMKSIIEGNGGLAHTSPELVIGSLSLVIWTITLLTTIKHVIIAMRANNHGEGGIFALYALVRGCGRWLIFPAMIGGAAMLADGVLTPAVTVTTAVEGLRTIKSMDSFLGVGQTRVIVLTLIIIIALFLVQRAGTSRIGKAFGPVMLLWFSFLGVTGLLHIFDLPSVLKAFNPVYAIKVLYSPYNKVGFMILGSVFLATTGAEALYSDMGHVGADNIYITWPFVKICLILNYLGQGAWLITNQANTALQSIDMLNPFFQMLPEALRPLAVVLGAAAAVIASQALITGSFTLVSEAIRLDLLPHLEVKYPADTKGQLYIPTVNHILMVGCIIIVLLFRSGSRMETAYGLAITVSMLTVTMLLTVYLWRICSQRLLALVVLIVFGAIEAVFFVSSLGKFVHGGYVAVIMAAVLFLIMLVWYRGTQLERQYCVPLHFADYVKPLGALHDDTSVPRMTHNLVYLDNSHDFDSIDRDILYSILDKDAKRAEAYWFISVSVHDEPSVMRYEVETYGTDYIFRVRLHLGFKDHQRVNVYLRQIVSDLIESGELPRQDKRHSIYGSSEVGNFKFCFLHKVVPPKAGLTSMDEVVLNVKYAIRHLAGSKVKWYGLDTSSLIIECVPLLVNQNGAKTKRITRMSEENK